MNFGQNIFLFIALGTQFSQILCFKMQKSESELNASYALGLKKYFYSPLSLVALPDIYYNETILQWIFCSGVCVCECEGCKPQRDLIHELYRISIHCVLAGVMAILLFSQRGVGKNNKKG